MFVVGVLKDFDIEWASKNTEPVMKMYWILDIVGMNIKFKEVTKDCP